MKIIKATGEKEEFNKDKIKTSVMNAGASQKLAEQIAKRVGSEIKEGTTTEKILDLTINSLKEYKCIDIAVKYDLKRAIMLLGPSGFSFEEYLAQILQNYGYKTTTNNFIKGKAVIQEVDVVASKDNKTSMIEAKYHNHSGIKTGTKVAMYTYARFLDIKSNSKNKFDDAWLVTNTKYTSEAIKYSTGVNLKLIGWGYPKNKNLQKLIEEKYLYPITIFKGISRNTKEHLFRAKIILAKDLANSNIKLLAKKTDLDKKTLEKVVNEAKMICNFKE